MAFAGSRRSDENRVLALSDELAADQLKEFLLGELGIEAPIEFRESEPLLEAECAEAGFSGP